MASSTFSTSLAQTLESLRDHLPSQLQSLIPTAAKPLQSTALTQYLPLAIQPYFEQFTPELVIGLAVAVFVVGFSMSRYPYQGRHASPFSYSSNRSPPRINDEDYHYMTDADIVEPSAGFYNQGGLSDLAPDILALRYRNTTYALHFPAYSIAEGVLLVGNIRSKAASKLGIRDPRTIRLLYKNRQLRDDAVKASEVGLKQNSELEAIYLETPTYPGDSESSADESDLQHREPARGPRVDVDGTLIHDDPPPRSSRRRDGQRQSRRNNRERDRDQPYPYSSFDTPITPSRSTFTPSTTASPAQPTYRPTPTSSAGDPQQSPVQVSQPFVPPPGPRTPREQLEDITAVFKTNYLPLCQGFIANPPTDPKTRDQEHKKLTETVLAQILLKLDGVDVEGKPDLRNARKQTVNEANAVLTQLDRAVGKGTR